MEDIGPGHGHVDDNGGGGDDGHGHVDDGHGHVDDAGGGGDVLDDGGGQGQVATADMDELAPGSRTCLADVMIMTISWLFLLWLS